MYTLLLIVFILVALLQILVILMQSSKGGGLAGSFGAGGMGAVFGSRGTATFLSKLTAGLAAAFMVLALVLGLLKSSESSSSSLIEKERQSRGSSPAAVGVPLVPGSESAPATTTPAPTTQPGQTPAEQQPK